MVCYWALESANDFTHLCNASINTFLNWLMEHRSKNTDLFLVPVWSARRPWRPQHLKMVQNGRRPKVIKQK